MIKPKLPYHRRQQEKAAREKQQADVRWLSRSLAFARRHSTVLTLVGGLLGWAILNSADAYSKLQAALHWWQVDYSYSGRWSNDSEGYLDDPPPGSLTGEDKVELAIHVENNEVMGDIYNSRLCKYMPTQYVFIQGRRRWWGWGGLRVYAWDHIHGQRTAFAEFEVRHDRKTDTLELRALAPTPLFPERVQLHRVDPSDGGSVSDKIDPFCNEFLDKYAGGARPPSSHAARRAASAAEQAAAAAAARHAPVPARAASSDQR